MALLSFNSLYIFEVANALNKKNYINIFVKLKFLYFTILSILYLLVDTNHGGEQSWGIGHQICENEFKTRAVTFCQYVQCLSDSS